VTSLHKGEDGTAYVVISNELPQEQDYGYLIDLTEKAALEAANKIMHEPTPHSEDDVQLVAGFLVQVLSQPHWKSEWRTGKEWVRLP
jgi:hypothetical protein